MDTGSHLNFRIRENLYPILLMVLIASYTILRSLFIPFPPWSPSVAQFALPIQLYSYAVGLFLYGLTQLWKPVRSIRNTPWMLFFIGGLGVILTQGDPPVICSLFLLSIIAKKTLL